MSSFETWTQNRMSERDAGRWQAIRAEWEAKINSIMDNRWILVADYAETKHRERTMLAPASSWQVASICERKGDHEILVSFRIVEIARIGFPDLYEAALVCADYKKMVRYDLCRTIPAYSPDTAIETFKSALASDRADQLTLSLGDDIFVRAFAATVSPENLEQELSQRSRFRPVPRNLYTEFDDIGRQFDRFFQKWSGTEELAHFEKHRGIKLVKRLFHRTEEIPHPLGLDFRAASASGTQPTAKRGRPKKGGREMVIAHLLGAMWQRCGLGEPKLSAQSRFIRACSQVLPWHNVYKADVAQFMRGELAKERRGDVVIG